MDKFRQLALRFAPIPGPTHSVVFDAYFLIKLGKVMHGILYGEHRYEMVQGKWVELQMTWHLNILELMEVLFALTHFVHTLRGLMVLITSDITTACAYFYKARDLGVF